MKRLLLLLFILVFSCDDIIEVEDISNETVVILAPANETVLDITDVTFSWQILEEAETYHLQVATPTFDTANQIVLDTVLTRSHFTKTLETKPYEWRVRAENSGFITAYTTQSFTIEE